MAEWPLGKMIVRELFGSSSQPTFKSCMLGLALAFFKACGGLMGTLCAHSMADWPMSWPS